MIISRERSAVPPPGPPSGLAGVTHATAGEAARIVSLVPNLTELLFDLGLQGKLAGRTSFCVHPEKRVKRIKIIGGTKTVKLDKLFAVNPTHVNVDETPRDLAEAIAARGARVIVTHPIEARDNLSLYRPIGGVFGRAREAEALCEDFEAAHGASSRPPPHCPSAASSTSSGRNRG